MLISRTRIRDERLFREGLALNLEPINKKVVGIGPASPDILAQSANQEYRDELLGRSVDIGDGSSFKKAVDILLESPVGEYSLAAAEKERARRIAGNSLDGLSEGIIELKKGRGIKKDK